MRRALAFALALALCGAAARRAHAQNLRGLPMGAESASLGHAGVGGVADDGSTYLNPAALVTVQGGALSLSTTLAAGSFLRIHRVPSDLVQNASFDQTEGTVDVSAYTYLPTALSYVKSWGGAVKLAAGGSLLVPVYDSYSISSRDRYSVTNSTLFPDGRVIDQSSARASLRRVLVGPSFAVGLTGLGLRFGVSLFASLSEMQRRLVASFVSGTVSHGLLVVEHLEQNETMRSVGLTAVFGAQWQPIAPLSIGVSFKSGIATLWGDGSLDALLRKAQLGVSTAVIWRSTMSDVSLPDPPELRAGVALRLGKRLELRADVLLTMFFGNPVIGTEDQTRSRLISGSAPSSDGDRIERRLIVRTTVNASIGARILLSPMWSLSLGALTDLSSSGDRQDARDSPDAPTTAVRWPKQDRFFGTVGVSIRSGLFDLHAGVAAGATFYQSRDFIGDGSDETIAAPVLRVFVAGGISTEDVAKLLL